MNPNDLTHNDARRQALWPDPLLCPDVPPLHTLRAYLTDADSLGLDLRTQIRLSPDCRRALARLREEQVPDLDPRSASTGDVTDLVRGLMTAARPPTPAMPLVAAPAPGQIWTTHAEADLFHTDTGRLGQVFCWNPPRILITGATEGTAWGDERVTAIPISDVLECPDWALLPADLEVSDRQGRDWIAHPSLAYTVSTRQLQRLSAMLVAEDYADIQARLAGAGAPETTSRAAAEEAERRAITCEFLSATATARQALYGAATTLLTQSQLALAGDVVAASQTEIRLAARDHRADLPVFTVVPELGALLNGRATATAFAGTVQALGPESLTAGDELQDLDLQLDPSVMGLTHGGEMAVVVDGLGENATPLAVAQVDRAGGGVTISLTRRDLKTSLRVADLAVLLLAVEA